MIDPIAARVGTAPGTLIHIGLRPEAPVRVRLIEFTADDFDERECAEEDLAAVCRAAGSTDRVSWIHVDGVHEASVIRTIGEALGIHPLTREDIMDATQRPKVEDYPAYRFLAVKMVHAEPAPAATGPDAVDADDDTDGTTGTWLHMQQVSIVAMKHLVVSFQERSGTTFDPLRNRIRTARGLVRTRGADYLAYALLDAIVDNYFLAIDTISDRADAIEEQLLEGSDEDLLAIIHSIRRDLIHLRHAVRPLRDVTLEVQSGASDLIQESTRVYLRDIHDHAVQALDLVETVRELIGSLRDHYMTLVSNRMNNVMKVLTVIGTIFLPLSFIAGVYGMNLNMPELQWPWAYPAVWGVMVTVAGSLLLYFNRKRWL